MDEITSKLFKDKISEPNENWAPMKAVQIQHETTNLPKGMRTPTPDELSAMEKFAKEYKRQSPKASRREIRRAIIKKFNAKILPNT